MVKKRISIITLSYNNLKYYKECLQSIVEQTYENIEWILCDDCSENFQEAEEKIKEFLKVNKGNIQNIVIHHNPKNLGVVKNYKQAIDMATGEYIFYLAVDDMFYDENVLSDVVEYFNKTGLQIFTGFRELFYENGTKRIQPFPHEIELLKNGTVEEIFKRSIRVCMIVGACTPFKKELIEEQGFVEDGYVHSEDWPRYLRLMENNIRIGFMERCLIKYRAGGITDEVSNAEMIADYRKQLDKYMRPPYSNLLSAMKEKKYIIAWGSSGGFIKYYKKWERVIGREITLIVDKDSKKWGSIVEGKEVFSPDKIKKLPEDELFVLIFSQVYYVEIAQQLEKMGLVEGEQFDIISREVVLWEPKM